MTKKNINGRGGFWFAIIASFSLAIMDMIFLRDVFTGFTGNNVTLASVIAFALATTANISALLWGKEVAQGKKGRSFFWGWVVMGVFYAIIRGYAIFNSCDVLIKSGKEVSPAFVMEQAIPVILLTISYIGSGTLIKWAAVQLWDKDVMNYLNSKREFEEQNKELANNKAAIWDMVRTFENYDENFKLLDTQYEKHKESIRKVEHSVMSQIVMKTVTDYPIDPIDAEKVMENVLAKRDQENEKLHDKQI